MPTSGMADRICIGLTLQPLFSVYAATRHFCFSFWYRRFTLIHERFTTQYDSWAYELAWYRDSGWLFSRGPDQCDEEMAFANAVDSEHGEVTP